MKYTKNFVVCHLIASSSPLAPITIHLHAFLAGQIPLAYGPPKSEDAGTFEILTHLGGHSHTMAATKEQLQDVEPATDWLIFSRKLKIHVCCGNSYS